MLKGLLTMLTASLVLWGVDMRLQRAEILRTQAHTEAEIRRLEAELRRIRSDVQESLAEPRLLMALEGLGYHRFYRDTRQLARRMVAGPGDGRLVENDDDDGPTW